MVSRGFATTSYFTDQHEYAVVTDGMATCGITNHAQEQLGDLVYVSLPEMGAEVSQGDSISVLESVKAATEMYAPVSGTVVEVNSELESDPGLVNRSPESEGWFVKIKVSDEAEVQSLMQREAYDAFAAADEH